MDRSFSPQTVQVLCMFLGAITSYHKFAIHKGFTSLNTPLSTEKISITLVISAQHTDGNPNDYVLD